MRAFTLIELIITIVKISSIKVKALISMIS